MPKIMKNGVEYSGASTIPQSLQDKVGTDTIDTGDTNLTSAVNTLNSRIQFSSTSANFTNSSLGSGLTTQTIHFYKWGRFVMAVHHGNVAPSSAGTYQLTGKIPAGYRPCANVFVPVNQLTGATITASRVAINEEGGVTYYIGATGQREFHFSICYIASE